MDLEFERGKNIAMKIPAQDMKITLAAIGISCDSKILREAMRATRPGLNSATKCFGWIACRFESI